MTAFSGTLFLEEETSPTVETVGSGASAFEKIQFGSSLWIASAGYDDADEIEMFDRLRRACVAVMERAQSRSGVRHASIPPVYMPETLEDRPRLEAEFERMTAETSLALEDDLAGAESEA